MICLHLWTMFYQFIKLFLQYPPRLAFSIGGLSVYLLYYSEKITNK